MAEAREVMRALNAAYDANDMEAYADLLATEVVASDNGGPPVRGRDDVMALATEQRRLFPDQTVERTHQVEDGEWVAGRWVLRATHSVDWPEVPATGQQIHLHGAVHARVAEGKVAELLQVWDEAAVLRQIGVLPES